MVTLNIKTKSQQCLELLPTMPVLQNDEGNELFLNLQVQQALKKHELLVALIKKDQDHNKRLVRSLKCVCYTIQKSHVVLATAYFLVHESGFFIL